MILAGVSGSDSTTAPVSVLSSKVLGNGQEYAHRRFNNMVLRRAAAILFHEPRDDTGKRSHRIGPGGGHDHGCFHDCGPNGVCACGVCLRNEVTSPSLTLSCLLRPLPKVAAELADEAMRRKFEAATGKEADLEKVRASLPGAIKCTEFSWSGVGQMVLALVAYCTVLALWWVLMCCWLTAWRPKVAQGSLPLLVVLCLAVCCVVAYEIIQGLVFASRLKVMAWGLTPTLTFILTLTLIGSRSWSGASSQRSNSRATTASSSPTSCGGALPRTFSPPARARTAVPEARRRHPRSPSLHPRAVEGTGRANNYKIFNVNRMLVVHVL